jgi:hypothetical protein
VRRKTLHAYAHPSLCRAGGMDEVDAMKITGHKSAHVFRHYDLGDVASLRERLATARAYARNKKVMPLRGNEDASAEQGVAG